VVVMMLATAEAWSGYFWLGTSLEAFKITAKQNSVGLYPVGASRKVHHASLHQLVGAPISFFDTTPVGRVLNRFSKDTDDMDYQLCVFSRPMRCAVPAVHPAQHPSAAPCHSPLMLVHCTAAKCQSA